MFNEIILAAAIELAINSHCAPLATHNGGWYWHTMKSVDLCRRQLNTCIYVDKNPVSDCLRSSNSNLGEK